MILMMLIAMIILGFLGAALSHYKANYYLRVVDDILGREEDEKPETGLGRGFIYGFLFPIYFVLLLSGLLALVAFLIFVGIIAAVVFVMVWVSEKILPHEWFGDITLKLFEKIGLKGAVAATEEAKTEIPGASVPPTPGPASSSDSPAEEPPKPQGGS
jgi:hypothetical protein